MSEWGEWLALEGRAGRADDAALWGVDLSGEQKKIEAALAELGRRVPDPAQPQTAPEADTLDRRSALDWLNALDVHPLAKKAFAAHLRSEYAVEPDHYSLLDFARWGAFYYNDPDQDEPAFRIVGGNDLLPQAMARALPEVRLGAQVLAIEQEGDVVRVRYRAGETAHSIESDFAVLAIPLGPARHIEFDPPLPPKHRAMLSGLTYGVATKILLQYRRRFWQEVGCSGSLLTDLPLTCTWEATRGQPGESGILTVYTGAACGAASAKSSEADRIADAIEQVDQIFSGSAREVIAARSLAWLTDSLALGAYAAFAPGEVTAHWDTLRLPVGRLFLAGEHTAVHQGYMEGALESGQRVAEEILTGMRTQITPRGADA